VSAAASLLEPAPELHLAGLVKRYGSRRALDGVDLQLRGCELVGVVGPDGAGKTTLLRAVAGLLQVEAREARVLDFDLRGDVRSLKERIGYVPQVFALNRDLSVLENLRFTARLHRIPPPDFERRAHTLLSRTGLEAFGERPAGALSGGMKQKLAVANALLPEPALLVLDEPTAGVDVLARAEIWGLLVERRERVLVLLSTSYLDEAAGCDRLVYLDAGRVVASGTPAELRSRAAVSLYRVWSDAPRELARAARELPFSGGVRASGRFARVEVPEAGAPPEAERVRRLAELPGARLVEHLPVDMESTLLALARDGGAAA
jgi:ABC-type multidrug transport system ATPase subunit